MNAVIVDIQGTYAAALCENGSIEKIPNDNYEIGQKIEMPAAEKPAAPKKLRGMSRTMRSLGTIAAVFALVVCTVSGIAYAMPYGTVSLDADASIEYTINCFNYVIDVKALNEDGDAVLDGMDSSLLLNKKIDRAVSATIEQETAEGYVDDETETVISVGTRGQAHSERLAGQLNDMMEHDMSAPAQVVPVTMDDVEAAHKNDMTAGRRWMQDNAAPEDGTDPGAKPDPAAPEAGGTQTAGGAQNASTAGADAAGSAQNTGTVPAAGSRPARQNGTVPAGTNGTGTENSGSARSGTEPAPEQTAQNAPQSGETAAGQVDPAAGTDTGAGDAAPEAPAGGTAAEDPGTAQPAAGAAEMPSGQENAEPMAESQQASD